MVIILIYIYIYILYRLTYDILKFLSFKTIECKCENGCHFAERFCYFPGLKTLILLKFMIIQLFNRYSNLTTYMSVAAISLDILIYAFFSIWKPWKV